MAHRSHCKGLCGVRRARCHPTLQTVTSYSTARRAGVERVLSLLIPQAVDCWGIDDQRSHEELGARPHRSVRLAVFVRPVDR